MPALTSLHAMAVGVLGHSTLRAQRHTILVLITETRRIRKQGYSELGRVCPGRDAMAVPIRDVHAHSPGTVAFHVPAGRRPPEQARTDLPRLQAAARELASFVGEPTTRGISSLLLINRTSTPYI